jgi:hypothetical protein
VPKEKGFKALNFQLGFRSRWCRRVEMSRQIQQRSAFSAVEKRLAEKTSAALVRGTLAWFMKDA